MGALWGGLAVAAVWGLFLLDGWLQHAAVLANVPPTDQPSSPGAPASSNLIGPAAVALLAAREGLCRGRGGPGGEDAA